MRVNCAVNEIGLNRVIILKVLVIKVDTITLKYMVRAFYFQFYYEYDPQNFLHPLLKCSSDLYDHLVTNTWWCRLAILSGPEFVDHNSNRIAPLVPWCNISQWCRDIAITEAIMPIIQIHYAQQSVSWPILTTSVPQRWQNCSTRSWWRQGIETLCALLAHQWPVDSPHNLPVMSTFGVSFFVVSLNKLING